MAKVKICGLSRREDIEYVNELQPDYIGFVFAESKRKVSKEQAGELKKLLNHNIKSVGVFVNAEQQLIAELYREGIIDIAQLHGDEDAEYCTQLKQLADVPVIKAVRVRSEESLAGLEAYPCDYFLFDTYIAGQYGGSGQRFDLKVLQGDVKLPDKPYFIAGGLDHSNVAAVIKEAEPFGVDVSGGVETNGIKDVQKIAAFIEQTRK